MPRLIPNNPIHLAPITWQHQIQENPNNSRDNKRRLHNQIDPLLKTLQMDVRPRIVQDLTEPFRLHYIDESDSKGGRENKAVSARPGYQAENADSGYGDGGVEEYLHAA